MFRFAHPELLYLLIIIPLLIVFYVVMLTRKKKAIAEFGNPELLAPLMPLLSFKRGTWKFVMIYWPCCLSLQELPDRSSVRSYSRCRKKG